MDAQTLIKKIRTAREVVLELEPATADVVDGEPGQPAKRVRIRRPAEAEMHQFLETSRADAAVSVVVGWEGFRECDLLGAAVGASDLVAFDTDLWREVVRDRADWITRVTARAVELVQAHKVRGAEDAKN